MRIESQIALALLFLATLSQVTCQFNETVFELSEHHLKERLYFRGTRQRGDALLDEEGKRLTFDSVQSLAKVNYRFPIHRRRVFKELITYLEIHAHQDSSEGDISVTTGGVNQHMVTLEVTAKNVKIFVTKVRVYGKLRT